MTRITHIETAFGARLRRFTVAALVAGSVFTLIAADGVDARPRSTSEVVAAEADRALESLANWQETRNPVDYVRFVQARESTAALTAVDLEIDPDQLRSAWAATGTEKQRAILAAMSQLGVPYRSLKSQPGVGFDCSGLTTWAYDQAGVETPRTSRDQFRAADEIEQSEAEAGDIVYYPGHVAIYLGAETMVHSPNSGSYVEAVHLPTRTLRYGDVVTALLEVEALSAVEPLSTALVDGAAAVSQ